MKPETLYSIAIAAALSGDMRGAPDWIATQVAFVADQVAFEAAAHALATIAGLPYSEVLPRFRRFCAASLAPWPVCYDFLKVRLLNREPVDW